MGQAAFQLPTGNSARPSPLAEMQRQLNGHAGRAMTPEAATPEKRGRRRMGAAARRRIAAEQKKRWAEYRKSQKAA
jgi:hypothetical protein